MTDKPHTTTQTTLHKETLQPSARLGSRLSATIPGLTIACHPDLSRIGEQARFVSLGAGSEAAISRLEPDFVAPGDGAGRPLADPYVPLSGGGVRLIPPSGGPPILDGAPLSGPRDISRDELERGLVLEIADRVVLLLHCLGGAGRRRSQLGIIGDNEEMERVRGQILKVADLQVPVLVRGETGTGKELVACAIHEASPRRPRPFLAVNMGATPASTAASELFGHARGAFTGAVKDHPGHFVRADGGTLFLDEIGETPPDVQAMLLRVLETGEVLPVGGRDFRKVDVRLVAATDADLEQACEDRSFRPALLHRLSGYVITLPPLRERRDDIGRLFVHFLRSELETIGEAWRLDTPASPDARPSVPAAIIGRLLAYHWPGNVRELKNVVRQLVISSRGAGELRLDPAIDRQLRSPVEAPAPPDTRTPAPEPAGYRDPSRVSEQEVVTALEKNRWRIGPAAKELRVSRTSLYALIDQSSTVRKAKDIPADEILRCRAECSGDEEEMASKLRVSKRALVFRLNELGIR